MNVKSLLLLALAALGVAGCSSSDAGSTASSQDPQARVDDAQKGIESSSMTPEQKQAALDYMKQGQASSQQVEQTAKTMTGGSSR